MKEQEIEDDGFITVYPLVHISEYAKLFKDRNEAYMMHLNDASNSNRVRLDIADHKLNEYKRNNNITEN
tara:strand:- start:658 stop:864 length:207 start_codon:yes stop_codon:yes gene_type:complete